MQDKPWVALPVLQTLYLLTKRTDKRVHNEMHSTACLCFSEVVLRFEDTGTVLIALEPL